MSLSNRLPSELLRSLKITLKQNNRSNFISKSKSNFSSWSSAQATYFSNDQIRSVRDCTSVQANRQWISDIKNDKPLALIFPWLQYPPKVVKKFVDVYLEQGWDCITFRLPVLTIASPQEINKITQNLIVPCLMSINHSKILLHGFCVGMLTLSRAYNNMNETERDMIFGRIRAQIWDSVVREDTSALGIARALVSPAWPRVQNGVKEMVEFYKTHSELGKIFRETQEIFDSCPVNANALFLASEADAIGSIENTNLVKEKWRQATGIHCTVKTWRDSDHVGHMRLYPQEYWRAVEGFVRLNGFPEVRGMWKDTRVLDIPEEDIRRPVLV